jgi:hypothetical protein
MKTMRTLTPILTRLVLPGAAVAMLAISSGATPLVDEGGAPETQRPVEQASLFPDAPYGVDPVVTGPVSANFRETREAFGCDRAVWPNVPAACYPD